MRFSSNYYIQFLAIELELFFIIFSITFRIIRNSIHILQDFSRIKGSGYNLTINFAGYKLSFTDH